MSLALRLAAPRDAEAVLAIYAPLVRDTIISFEVEPPSRDEMARRIRTTLDTFPWLVLQGEGKVVAYAYASPHASRVAYQWSVDVTVYVAPSMQRQGCGQRLYRALFRILRAQGYRSALAGITLPNDASVGLHESLGFERVGVYHNIGYKLGAWRDVGWWGMPLQPYDPAPPAPRPLPVLVASGELERLLDELPLTKEPVK